MSRAMAPANRLIRRTHVEAFRFKDELYRDGRLGMNLFGLSPKLLAR